MSSDPAITTLIISATYAGVVGYGETTRVVSGSPYNPASALGLFFSILFNGKVGDSDGLWLFLFFGYAGAALAVLLFECVYKKAMQVVEQGADMDDDDVDEERSEHDSLMPTANEIDE